MLLLLLVIIVFMIGVVVFSWGFVVFCMVGIFLLYLVSRVIVSVM